MSSTANRINFLLLFLALVCCCQSANAQGLTGQISGTLTDPNGGVVPNAKVEVINEETARTVAATSDSEGNFVVPQLLSGTYTLIVTANGFKRFEQRGIILTANERVDVRQITLEVGDVNQTVSVTGETALVQTESAERAGLIDEEQIQNIALKGRDYMGLVRLLPGVVDTANREAPGWNNLVGITVNGSPQRYAQPDARRRLVARHRFATRAVSRARPRRHRRSQSAADELSGRVRPQQRRHDQRGHQERHARFSRRRLLFQAPRTVQRQRILQQPARPTEATLPLQLLGR